MGDSLATLENEAARRGVSLSALLAEAVDEKAAGIRAARRPRVGMGRSIRSRARFGAGRAPAVAVALVLDTGPLLAAFDAADPDHEACAALLTRAEACLLDDVYRVEPPTVADLERRRAIQEQNADLSVGVVDASVLALVERLGEAKLATLDRRHFSVMRPAQVEAPALLP